MPRYPRQSRQRSPTQDPSRPASAVSPCSTGHRWRHIVFPFGFDADSAISMGFGTPSPAANPNFLSESCQQPFHAPGPLRHPRATQSPVAIQNPHHGILLSRRANKQNKPFRGALERGAHQ